MKRAIAVLLGLLASGPNARADSADEARFYDARAREAYANKRYEEALESFSLSELSAPNPRNRYNMAVCAELAGRAEEAFTFLVDYLEGKDPDAGRRKDAEARLDRFRRTLALVHVESDPPGAAIYVDRRDLGIHGATPRTIAVERGSHRIQLEKEGYRIREVPIAAVAGKEVTVAAKLDHEVGTLRLRVKPDDALVSISFDGKEIQRAEAHSSWRMAAAHYGLRISAPGYEALERDVVIVGDRTEIVEVALAPEVAKRGRLLIDTGRVKATAELDGTLRTETPASLGDVAIGRHRVRIDADGHRTWSGEVNVTEAHTTYLNVTLSER
jgi:hypothetical protein